MKLTKTGSANDELKRLRRFKKYWDELAGEGLEISNWHLNGNTEPLYNFYVDALEAMDKDDEDGQINA